MGDHKKGTKGVSATAPTASEKQLTQIAEQLRGVDMSNFDRGDFSTTNDTLAMALLDIPYGEVEKAFRDEGLGGELSALIALRGSPWDINATYSDESVVDDNGITYASQNDVWESFKKELFANLRGGSNWNVEGLEALIEKSIIDMAYDVGYINPRRPNRSFEGIKGTMVYTGIESIKDALRSFLTAARASALMESDRIKEPANRALQIQGFTEINRRDEVEYPMNIVFQRAQGGILPQRVRLPMSRAGENGRGLYSVDVDALNNKIYIRVD